MWFAVGVDWTIFSSTSAYINRIHVVLKKPKTLEKKNEDEILIVVVEKFKQKRIKITLPFKMIQNCDEIKWPDIK